MKSTISFQPDFTLFCPSFFFTFNIVRYIYDTKVNKFK
uniref:Uncharacterized protein n=1 Tax=Arundo donax TaxID=35708 RepID=A0A0A9D8B6_ARUDO